MATSANETRLSPFEIVGGGEVVRLIVDRFYDLMDGEPEFAQLRALHADDLTPMRASLSGFLNAWLGGPRDWFAEHPGVCVMSAHAKVSVDQQTATQWVDAMRRAVTDTGINTALVERMIEALSSMAMGMIRR